MCMLICSACRSKTRWTMKPWCVFAMLILILCAIVSAQDNSPLRLTQTIPLPGVEGRIDHLSADVKGQKLFAAALGNNTLEVVDLALGKRVRSITGLKEPQGVVFVPDLNRVFVANGGDGTIHAYDAASFALVSSLKLGPDADNVRYDAAHSQIFVGFGSGALGLID